MSTPQYFEKYENLAFTRDDDGVLVLRFHTNGRAAVFSGQTHSDFTDRPSRKCLSTPTTGAGHRWNGRHLHGSHRRPHRRRKSPDDMAKIGTAWPAQYDHATGVAATVGGYTGFGFR
jgi:hypothetical protein